MRRHDCYAPVNVRLAAHFLATVTKRCGLCWLPPKRVCMISTEKASKGVEECPSGGITFRSIARKFRMTRLASFASSTLIALAVLSSAACGGPQAVRGDDVAGLDDEAMSTGLDQRDLQKLLRENLQSLESAAVIARWQKEDRPAVAVMPLRNETSEHIDSALDALISDIETTLVNAGHVRVISMENQAEMIEKVRSQYGDAFDPNQAAQWGRQVGARYIVTGKVFSTDERQDDTRRVQYSLFLQVLDVETSDILFQNKANVTKAMIR